MQFLKRNHSYLISLVFIFMLFQWITSSVGLYGDDWCYFTNTNATPIQAAIDYYAFWSGRFFSEVWTYFAVHNKNIYNVVNPILFVLIFLGILYFVKPTNKLLSVLTLVMLMLSVYYEIIRIGCQ